MRNPSCYSHCGKESRPGEEKVLGALRQVRRFFRNNRFNVSNLTALSADWMFQLFSRIKTLDDCLGYIQPVIVAANFGQLTVEKVSVTRRGGYTKRVVRLDYCAPRASKNTSLCTITEVSASGRYHLLVNVAGGLGSGQQLVPPAVFIRNGRVIAKLSPAAMLAIFLTRSLWAVDINGRRVSLSMFPAKAGHALSVWSISRTLDSNNAMERAVFWQLERWVHLSDDDKILGAVARKALNWNGKTSLEECMRTYPLIASEMGLLHGYGLPLDKFVRMYPIANWVKPGKSFAVDGLDKAAKLVARYKGLGLSRNTKYLGLDKNSQLKYVNVLFTNEVDVIGTSGCSAITRDFASRSMHLKETGIHIRIAHDIEIKVGDSCYKPLETVSLKECCSYNKGDVVLRRISSKEPYFEWHEGYTGKVADIDYTAAIAGGRAIGTCDIKFVGEDHLWGGDKARGGFRTLTAYGINKSRDAILFKSVMYVMDVDKLVAADGTEVHMVATTEGIKNPDVCRRTAIAAGLYDENATVEVQGVQLKGVLMRLPFSIEQPPAGHRGGSRASMKIGGDKASYTNLYVMSYGEDHPVVREMVRSMDRNIERGKKHLAMLHGVDCGDKDILRNQEAWDRLLEMTSYMDFMSDDWPGAVITKLPDGSELERPVTVLPSDAWRALSYPCSLSLNRKDDSWADEEELGDDSDEPRDLPVQARDFLNAVLGMARGDMRVTATHLLVYFDRLRSERINGRIVADMMRWEKLLVSSTVAFLPGLEDRYVVVPDWMTEEIRTQKKLSDKERIYAVIYRYPKLNVHLIPAQVISISEYNQLVDRKPEAVVTIYDTVEGRKVTRKRLMLDSQLNTSIVFAPEAFMNLTNGDSDGDRIFIMPLDRGAYNWAATEIARGSFHAATRQYSEHYADYSVQKFPDCYAAVDDDPVAKCNKNKTAEITIEAAIDGILQACKCKCAVGISTLGYFLTMAEVLSGVMTSLNTVRTKAGPPPFDIAVGARYVQESLDGIKSNSNSGVSLLDIDVNEFTKAAVLLSESFDNMAAATGASAEAIDSDKELIRRFHAVVPTDEARLERLETANMLLRVTNGGQIGFLGDNGYENLGALEALAHMKERIIKTGYKSWLADKLLALTEFVAPYNYSSFEDIAFGVTKRMFWDRGLSAHGCMSRVWGKISSVITRNDTGVSIWDRTDVDFDDKVKFIAVRALKNYEACANILANERGFGFLRSAGKEAKLATLAFMLIASAWTDSKRFYWPTNWKTIVATMLLNKCGRWHTAVKRAADSSQVSAYVPRGGRRCRNGSVIIDSERFVVYTTNRNEWLFGKKYTAKY